MNPKNAAGQQHESSRQSEEDSQQSVCRSNVIPSSTFNESEWMPQQTRKKIRGPEKLARKQKLLKNKQLRAERREAAELLKQRQIVVVKEETLSDPGTVTQFDEEIQSPKTNVVMMFHCLGYKCAHYFSSPIRHNELHEQEPTLAICKGQKCGYCWIEAGKLVHAARKY